MGAHEHDRLVTAFEKAGTRLFTECGVEVASRLVRLAEPPIAVRVLEVGDGQPLVLVHGGGMSASTWAPLMPYLATHAGSRRNRPARLRVPT